MSKQSEYNPYRDKFGLIQTQEGTPSLTTDNGLINTVEYFLILSDSEKKVEVALLKQTLKYFEQKTQHGVVVASPTDSSKPISKENAIALLIFSEMFDKSRLAKSLFRHGELTRAIRIDYRGEEESLRAYPLAWLVSGLKAPNRFYNTRQFDWSYETWWGKDLQFISLLELLALDRTSFIKLFILWLSLFTKRHRTNYLIWSWIKQRNSFWNYSYKMWNFVLKYIFKTSMKKEYEKIYGKNHPLVKHIKEK